MLPHHGLGFAVGESLYYRLKLTSNKPSNYTYYVNHIECIDILEHFESINNINLESFNQYISSLLNGYDQKIMNHAIKVIKPNKRSIAFLKEILDAYSIDNTLGFYLSKTSKYHIPKWKTGF